MAKDGEEWRRLKVTFPDHIASHTKTQITHLARRADAPPRLHGRYSGRNTGANYVSGYRDFRDQDADHAPHLRLRRAHAEGPEPVLVSLDFGQLTFN